MFFRVLKVTLLAGGETKIRSCWKFTKKKPSVSFPLFYHSKKPSKKHLLKIHIISYPRVGKSASLSLCLYRSCSLPPAVVPPAPACRTRRSSRRRRLLKQFRPERWSNVAWDFTLVVVSQWPCRREFWLQDTRAEAWVRLKKMPGIMMYCIM